MEYYNNSGSYVLMLRVDRGWSKTFLTVLLGTLSVFFHSGCSAASVKSEKSWMCQKLSKERDEGAASVSIVVNKNESKINVDFRNTGTKDIKFVPNIAEGIFSDRSKAIFYLIPDIVAFPLTEEVPGYLIIFPGQTHQFIFERKPIGNKDKLNKNKFFEWEMLGLSTENKPFSINCILEH
jgi:hypothetical protein